LNGTSSSGKSSLAKALQDLMEAPYLHVCVDTFEEMVPSRPEVPDGSAEHPVFNRMLSGFHHSIAALARCGNNLIVDHVLIQETESANWVTECLSLIAEFEVSLIGVHCPLDELERREEARGDRPDGLARWQFPRMHGRVAYDLEVDTSQGTPSECAKQIGDALRHCPRSGLRTTLANMA